MKDESTDNPAVHHFHVDESISLEEQIARRTLELWQLRGRTPGHVLADWLQAEREVNEWHQQRLRKTT